MKLAPVSTRPTDFSKLTYSQKFSFPLGDGFAIHFLGVCENAIQCTKGCETAVPLTKASSSTKTTCPAYISADNIDY